MEPFYPLHVRRLRRVLPRAARASTSRREEIFTEYAYFSSYSDSWLEHARDYAEQMIASGFGLGAEQPGRRARQQRRLPAAVFRRRGASRARHRAGANVAAVALATRRADPIVEFFGRELAAELVAERRPGRPGRRQQRAGAGAGPERLRRRHRRRCSAPHGRGHDRVPAPACGCSRRTSSTRSTTSTSPTSRSRPPSGSSPRTGSTIFDVEELPTHGGSLRIYARHARPTRQPVAGASRRFREREEAAGLDDARDVRRVRGAGRRRPSASCSSSSIAAKRDGKRSPATARRARATRCSTTAASAPTSSTSRSTATRTSTVGSCPARTSRSTRPSGSRETQARLHPDPALEPEGRDRRAAGPRPRVGRRGSSSPIPDADASSGAADEGRPVLRRAGAAPARVLGGVPKPMVPIGYRPILWHVMRYYAHFGHKDFILCLGYKADVIKEYFLHYNEALSNDFVLSEGGATVELLQTDIQDWRDHVRRHRPARDIGQRLRARPAPPRGRGDLPRQLRRRPDRRRLPTTWSSTFRASGERRPASSPCSPTLHLPRRRHRRRRPRRRRSATSTDSDLWINGGYFVFRPEIFDYIEPGEELVEEPFARLIDARPAARLPVRRLLGADGHAQGPADSSRSCTRRGTAVGGLGAGRPRRVRSTTRRPSAPDAGPRPA